MHTSPDDISISEMQEDLARLGAKFDYQTIRKFVKRTATYADVVDAGDFNSRLYNVRYSSDYYLRVVEPHFVKKASIDKVLIKLSKDHTLSQLAKVVKMTKAGVKYRLRKLGIKSKPNTLEV